MAAGAIGLTGCAYWKCRPDSAPGDGIVQVADVVDQAHICRLRRRKRSMPLWRMCSGLLTSSNVHFRLRGDLHNHNSYQYATACIGEDHVDPICLSEMQKTASISSRICRPARSMQLRGGAGRADACESTANGNSAGFCECRLPPSRRTSLPVQVPPVRIPRIQVRGSPSP